jgi:hypothetical protein
MAVAMKISVLWNVTTYNLIHVKQSFPVISSLYLGVASWRRLQDVGTYPPNYTASHPQR